MTEKFEKKRGEKCKWLYTTTCIGANNYKIYLKIGAIYSIIKTTTSMLIAKKKMKSVSSVPKPPTQKKLLNTFRCVKGGKSTKRLC